jgi:hypothetical protein
MAYLEGSSFVLPTPGKVALGAEPRSPPPYRVRTVQTIECQLATAVMRRMAFASRGPEQARQVSFRLQRIRHRRPPAVLAFAYVQQARRGPHGSLQVDRALLHLPFERVIWFS